MSFEMAKHEDDFATALLNSQADVPQALKRQSGQPPGRRFAVYRNNVYASLIDVLASRFPVCAKLVGEEFFRAMGRLYVEESPPSSPVLLYFGKSFPDFASAFPPAKTVPYLGDVARIEWARHEAYHAADATPLPHDALASFGADVETLTLSLHPSLRLVRSPYPVMTIWSLALHQGRDEPITLPEGGEDVLVIRPVLDVEMCPLPEGGLAFVKALLRGESLLAAASEAAQAVANFDLAANLASLMTRGAIVGAAVNKPSAD